MHKELPKTEWCNDPTYRKASLLAPHLEKKRFEVISLFNAFLKIKIILVILRKGPLFLAMYLDIILFH